MSCVAFPFGAPGSETNSYSTELAIYILQICPLVNDDGLVEAYTACIPLGRLCWGRQRGQSGLSLVVVPGLRDAGVRQQRVGAIPSPKSIHGFPGVVEFCEDTSNTAILPPAAL